MLKREDSKEVYDCFVGLSRYFKAMSVWVYTKTVVAVQAEVLAMFLLKALQQVGANELT